jgi:hypothetical protein
MENLNHQRTAQPNLSLLSRGAINSGYCTCRGMHQEKRLLQRPVLLSLEKQYRHDRRCPSWLPEVYALNVNFGFILSYLVFGLKLRILMALSIGASMTSFDPSQRTLRKNSMELSRIFQTRQSSPHDRLENGQTLLHVSTIRFVFLVLELLSCISIFVVGSLRAYGLYIPAS